jgi:mevalonate kinase
MIEHLTKPYGTRNSDENKNKNGKQKNEIRKTGVIGSSQCIESESESESEGIHIVNYRNDLPMGKGLSSSAAVCVLVAKCFNEVCNRVVIKWC